MRKSCKTMLSSAPDVGFPPHDFHTSVFFTSQVLSSPPYWPQAYLKLVSLKLFTVKWSCPLTGDPTVSPLFLLSDLPP